MATFNINSIKAENVLQAETINFESTKKNSKNQIAKSYWQLVGERSFGTEDYLSLKKAGLTFTQFDTIPKFFNALNRKTVKGDGELFLHFSGHSRNNTLIIGEEFITITQIEEIPNNTFEIVLLASCENFAIVDSFVSISKHCVGFLNEIETSLASLLTELFWTQIQSKSFEEVMENSRKSSELGKFIYGW